MNVHLVSLGCARNLVDSENMLGLLRDSGWSIVEEPGKAHLIIVNTCGFIEPAIDQSIDTILELAKFKKNGICRKLIVAGCLAQRFGKDIAKEMPEVDFFLGTGAFDKISDAAAGILKESRWLFPDPDLISYSPLGHKRVKTLSYLAYLKIAEGCSRHCTYCIIPKLRGRQKSRPADDILKEAEELINSGVKELVLVAQDSTAYGKDLQQGIGLDELLSELSGLSSGIWIRILYGHPESIDDRIIKTVAKKDNICSYFDLPIQHASDSALKRMGRGHGKEELYGLFHKIRSIDSRAVLRTTAIVGFPGETEKEFNELMKFAKKIGFDNLGVFIYSDSEDLLSHKLKDHVPRDVAQKRYDRLMALQCEISQKINEKYLDQTMDVLIEERAGEGTFTGRTMFQAPEVDGIVYVHGENIKTGEFARVKITDTLEYDLIGEIL